MRQPCRVPKSASSSPVSPSRGPLLAAALIMALLAANWVAAVARFQVNALYWDQWDFCAPLFRDHTWLDLFTQQHGPHRQGLGFVFSAWVMEASAWDSRVESLWIASLLVVAAGLAVIWKWRVSGRFGWLDLWLPIAALAMRQYETVIVAPNASHSIFPLVLMLLAALVLTQPLTGWRWALLAVLGLVALFTGFGIFVWAGLGWVAGLRLLRAARDREGRRVAGPLLGVVGLLAALGWFARGYVFNPASPGATFPHWPLTDYPEFVTLMLASRMDLATPTAAAYVAGAVMLILGTAAGLHASWRLWRDPEPAPAYLAAAYLLAAGLGFAWFTASGRVHLGAEAGFAPRYTSLMLSFWLGLVAWAVAKGAWPWRIGAMVLGWAMVIAPWADLGKREWRDWPGTLGMSLQSRDALTRTQGTKAEWLLAWQESGANWRETERRAPLGIHPQPEAARLEERIEFMRERGLSFTATPGVAWAWLPWWNPIGVTWLKGTGGEHAQWMAEEARLLIEGREAGFLNLRLLWHAPAWDQSHPVEIVIGEHRALLTYREAAAGISFPAPKTQHILTLRSPDGTVPLDPPNDLREGSFLVEDPTLTAEPTYAVRGWLSNADGLWAARSMEVVAGLHDWEGEGAWVWSEARVGLVCRALQPAFLNVEIESRYAAVNEGPVLLRVGESEITLPWREGGLRFAVPVPAGLACAVEIVNAAGAKSPQEVGESGDGRRLALRFERLSLDDEAMFPILRQGLSSK